MTHFFADISRPALLLCVAFAFAIYVLVLFEFAKHFEYRSFYPSKKKTENKGAFTPPEQTAVRSRATLIQHQKA